MRIEKRNDGWWIAGIAPYRVDGVVYDAYGPYPTKAAAQEDVQGLESFFEQHPELTAAPPLLEAGDVQERQYTAHWFVKSLAYRPPSPPQHRPLKSSPGQRRLPGME
ncbi:MAG: hypothetical protein ACC628_25080 [Pirellulaceae bacterium]